MSGKKTSNSEQITAKGITKPDWYLEHPDYSIRFEVIGNSIIYTEAHGTLRVKYVKDFFSLHRKVLREMNLSNKKYYRIADWKGLKSSSWRARKLYLDELAKLNKEYICLHSVIFGINKFMNTVVTISSRFTPFKISRAKDLAEAISIIERVKQGDQLQEDGKPQKELDLTDQEQFNKNIDELLQFMGAIDWNQKGIGSVEKVDQSNPFKEIYESTELIKHDFDTILTEKLTAEQELHTQNKYNKLRAEIWKVAANTSLQDEELIQKLLDLVGPAIGVSRACFNKLVGNEPHKSKMICTIEWCEEGAKPSLGTKVPNSVLKYFVPDDFFMLTYEAGLKMIPKPFREPAKPILKLLKKSLNLESVLLVPYYAAGRMEGILTFDICSGKTMKPDWAEDAKEVIKELISIVTNHIIQKKTEEELSRYRIHLEQLVEERTSELEIAKKSAERANKAKDEFLANISHEIRTPLNAILGFSEIIKSGDSSEKTRSNATMIIRESEILIDLVNELLDISKVEAGKIELENFPFDLTEMMDSIKSIMTVRAHRKSLDFTISLEKNIPAKLMGDPTRLRQILVNIMNNAIKFTHHGSISVIIKLQKELHNKVDLYFEVKDTGIGIPAAKQQVIFESFVQADGSTTRNYGGTGLGTTISKKLVELMKGEIGVNSEVGKGSTFWFTVGFDKYESLPFEQEPLKENHKLERIATSAKEKDIHDDLGGDILLVEDYPANQEITKTHLTRAGYAVDVAENGQEAVAAANKKAYSLILMDLQMPVMDGFDATSLIRTECPNNADTPILAMTGNAYEKDRKRCLDTGMNGVITKPVRKKKLLQVIDHWLLQKKK